MATDKSVVFAGGEDIKGLKGNGINTKNNL